MGMTRSSGCVAALVVMGASLVGAAAAPPRGLEFAYAAPDCAPWDGAAVAIYMGGAKAFATGTIPDRTPFVQVAIWRAADVVAGQTFDVSAVSKVGAAISCRAATTDCERASSGTIRLDGRRPGGAFEGTLDLTFPSRGRVTGGFHATWVQRRVFCG